MTKIDYNIADNYLESRTLTRQYMAAALIQEK